MRRVYRAAVLVIVSILFLDQAGIAQQQSSRTFARNSFYVEGATQSSPYTINYDRLFHLGDQLAFAYRLGFSVYNQDITVPVGLSVVTGPNSHHFELSTTLIPYLKLNDSKNDPTNLFLYLIPAAGYRFQKPDGGLFFKASVGPAFYGNPGSSDFWDMNVRTYAYGSLALGISL